MQLSSERVPALSRTKVLAMETHPGRTRAVDTPINGAEQERLTGSPPQREIVPAALTKEELQNLLFENLGLSKRECREMVNAIFEEMRSALEAGETVKLEGFGRFQPRERPQRWARNLRSGERITVSKRRVVTFHPSRKLTGNIRMR